MRVNNKLIMIFIRFRKTCLQGFLSGISCVKKLVPDLLPEQRYVMTYRLSQDHLELFFNSVRKAGKPPLH